MAAIPCHSQRTSERKFADKKGILFQVFSSVNNSQRYVEEGNFSEHHQLKFLYLCIDLGIQTIDFL